MAGGSCGRGSLRSEATGALAVLSAPGQRWERLGARSGVAAGAPWSARRREAERGEEVLTRTPASASRTPARLEPRGQGDSTSARAGDGWGEARNPQFGGSPRGRSSKDPHPRRAHTHTCWRPARLTRALPAPCGRPGGQTTDLCPRIHTSVHMCAQTYLPHTSAHWGSVTSSEPAPASARSAARTHNPWPHRATDHCTFGRTNTILCLVQVSRPQLARRTLKTDSLTHGFL